MFNKKLMRFLCLAIMIFTFSIGTDFEVYAVPSSELNTTHPSQPTTTLEKKKSSATLSELYRKFPETMLTKGPKQRRIALTFDDVPDPRFTSDVLDILSKYHVKATFFIVGQRAKKHPELVRRIHREGHAIGNHSYNHPLFTKISMDSYKKQILHTEQIIDQLIHYKPKLIRPPYGEITEEQLKWAKKQGYKIVNWNVDSLDWKGLNKEEVMKNILTHVGPGSIILQHAGGGVGADLNGTVQALPEVIKELTRKGYSFVTVPELLQINVKKIPSST
ncbi:polysaccharide deacetylase family protein [Paenibacillus sp. CMAA1364]